MQVKRSLTKLCFCSVEQLEKELVLFDCADV